MTSIALQVEPAVERRRLTRIRVSREGGGQLVGVEGSTAVEEGRSLVAAPQAEFELRGWVALQAQIGP